jgi:hypothetical protein
MEFRSNSPRFAGINAVVTEKQVLANRRNAMLSRGPKTLVGKATSSRNALRHGLAISVARDPGSADEIERLAGTLTDKGGRP